MSDLGSFGLKLTDLAIL